MRTQGMQSIAMILAAILLLLSVSSAIHANAAPTDDNKEEDKDPIVRHSDRPDKDCATNPLLGKCLADCNSDHSKCECPSGFHQNEQDHCAVNKCPKGFEQHRDDETGTCFPIKDLSDRKDHDGGDKRKDKGGDGSGDGGSGDGGSGDGSGSSDAAITTAIPKTDILPNFSIVDTPKFSVQQNETHYFVSWGNESITTGFYIPKNSNDTIG